MSLGEVIMGTVIGLALFDVLGALVKVMLGSSKSEK